MYYVLTYDLADDYLQRRKEDGDEHLHLLRAAVARGELIMGGALIEPVDQGLYLFQGESPAVAERFAQQDSYVRRGFVKQWKVRPWMTIVGAPPAP